MWKSIISFSASITILLYLTACGTNDKANRTEAQQQDAISYSKASFSRTTIEPDSASVPNITFEPKEWEFAGRLPKGLYDNAAAVWNGFLYISGGFGPGPDVNTDEIFIFQIMPDNTVDLHDIASIPNKPITFNNGAKGIIKGID